MNILIKVIKTSLLELQLGLKGELSMSEAMEELMNSISLENVPGTWASHAYPSLKKLSGWMSDLEARLKQLNEWSGDLALPKCVWLSGLFNP